MRISKVNFIVPLLTIRNQQRHKMIEIFILFTQQTMRFQMGLERRYILLQVGALFKIKFTTSLDLKSGTSLQFFMKMFLDS